MAYLTNAMNLRDPRMGAGLAGANAGLSAAKFSYVTDDVAATVIAAAYVDDALDKGIQVNDVLEIVDVTTPLVTHHVCTLVDVSSNAAGDATFV